MDQNDKMKSLRLGEELEVSTGPFPESWAERQLLEKYDAVEVGGDVTGQPSEPDGD